VDEEPVEQPGPVVNRFEFTITAEAEVIKADQQPEQEEDQT
jgi:hypothetical protein